MAKRFFMLLAALFISYGVSLAQTQVTGTVVDDTGEPVIGAAVKLVGGGNVGTITNSDGQFKLTVPSSNSELDISFLGMGTKRVRAGKNLQVELNSKDNTLDEVMVVAYGTAKKSSFTGSAENVDASKLELRPITNVVKGLEGETSGVQMTSGGGQPGSSPNIRIRGFGSINASSAPLYVVDGMAYDGDIASINPNDIEQMTVLKDASAGALYGARGANGVIIITTKKGQTGKVNVTWRSTIGWSNRATKSYKNVNQKEYVQLIYEGLRNGYAFDNGYSWADAESQARADLSSTLGGELYNPFKNYSWDNIIDPATGQVRSDAQSAWQEDWMASVKKKNAFRHEHQLSLNGGTDKTQFMLSLGYLNEDGIMKTTNYQRYSARTNVNSQVTDWFSMNLGANLAYSDQNFLDYDDSPTATSNPWYTAQFVNPLFPVYLKNLDGTNALDENGKAQYDWGENGRIGSLNDFSSLGGLMLDKTSNKRDIAGLRTGIVVGSDSDRFGWAKGLKLAVNFGFDYNNTEYMTFMNTEHGNQAANGGLIERYNYRTQSYTFNQLVTWNRSFGLHNIDLLVGHEWYQYDYSVLGAGKTNIIEAIKELRPGTNIILADSYSQTYRINSFLSRLNYNWNDTYYFSASLRTDASSRFYSDNHTGTFWSVGGNWRISNEQFMKPLTWIDNLSLKVSYGEQGNDNLLDALGYQNYYAWQALYDLDYANASQKGALVASLENRDITWEKNGNLNIGLEGLLLNQRLRFSVEFYNKRTTNMLLSYPMALSTGFSGYDANVGNMRNRGWEFELSGSPVKTRDWEWNLSWMGSTVSNKVTKLTAETPEIISGNYIIREGAPINTFYLAKTAGVDPATGAQLYWAYDKDDDGNITREYITDDYSAASNSKYEMGSRIPDLYGSIGSTLRWKDLTLSVLTTYSIGGKVYDGLYASSMSIDYLSSTWNKNVLRRWQKPGDVTDVPRIEIAGAAIATDQYLINASYFAIKNITLGYYLPKQWMRAAGLNSVRVFGSFDNVALFTHLDGMDPQYNFSGSTNYTYAPNKTISFGIEVNF